MANGKKPTAYKVQSAMQTVLNQCQRFRGNKVDQKELERYVVRDNLNNTLVVSVILMIISAVKCIFRANGVWFTDSGIGMFIIAVVYIFTWVFIKSEIIESQLAQRYFYEVFWIFISFVGMRYLSTELKEYGTITNFVITIFLLSGFYIAPIKSTLFLVGINLVIALEMVAEIAPKNGEDGIDMAIVLMLSIISITILLIKYWNYVKDKRARIALRKVGGIDTLTHLLNRRGFEERIEEEWCFYRDARKTVRVLMIDIDNFKNYNDTYGHIAGDQCLKDVTEQIYNIASRKTDLVVRYGGEEIIIVLPDATEEECLEMSIGIQERVNGLHIDSGKDALHPFVTVSIGIAGMFVTNNNTIYDIVDKADEQLYFSKDRGRNCITMNDISVDFNRTINASS